MESLVIQRINHIHEKVLGLVCEVEPYKLLVITQQLISRIEIKSQLAQKLIVIALARIATKYPLQSVWWLLPLKFFDYPNHEKSSKYQKSSEILKKVQDSNKESYKIIEKAEQFYSEILMYSMHLIQPHQRDKKQLQVMDSLVKENDQWQNCLILPTKKNIFPQMPQTAQFDKTEYCPFERQPIYIKKLAPQAEVIQSKERPIKIRFVTDNGDKYFLLKMEHKSDVRKESRTIDFINFLNVIIQKSNNQNIQECKMPTYSIIPLSKQVGLVEWVEGTATIKSLIEQKWREKKYEITLMDVIKKINNSKQQTVPSLIWKEITSKKPVLQSYFTQAFEDNDKWYDSLLNFIKTSASWSVLQYIIGLGDRHLDNVLLEKNTGKVIHIDFDCIFDKGKYLPVPELPSFRLTNNIEAALGVFGSYGLYFHYMVEISKIFKKNSESILRALDSFIYDPQLSNQLILCH